jgi:hypothetical protein
MGSYRHVRSRLGSTILLGMLGIIVLLAFAPQSEASTISRRQAIRRSAVQANVDLNKVYRIGVKNMPPMCFFDPSLPADERFSGVRNAFQIFSPPSWSAGCGYVSSDGI